MSTKRAFDRRRTAHSRAYEAPVLVKGPVLTTVTAASKVSGSNSDCWVARAAFGESDLRWMIFREWLMVDAPAWFRNLYVRHGEAIGAWLRGQPLAQAVVRRLMMPAVTRTLGK
jgi:hypothetical protein